MVPVYLSTAQGSSNYKVDVSLALKVGDFLSSARQFRAAIDTGAAPVIVCRDALPIDAEIRPLREPPLLIDAQRKAISILGVVSCRVKMGRKDYPVQALVAKTLSVDLLLGTQFIDKFVQVINARRRHVLMDFGDEVPLVACTPAKQERVFVSEKISIPPRSEAVVPVHSNASGLCLITSSGRLRVAATNGLHEIEKGEIFLTKVGNFGKSSVTLTPGMIIGQANAHVDNTLFNSRRRPPMKRKSVDIRERE